IDVADDAAARGGSRGFEGAVGVHYPGAGIPDAVRSEPASWATALQPRPAVAGRAAGRRLEGLDVHRPRRKRQFQESDARYRAARVRVPDRRVDEAGTRVVLHGDPGRACTALQP